MVCDGDVVTFADVGGITLLARAGAVREARYRERVPLPVVYVTLRWDASAGGVVDEWIRVIVVGEYGSVVRFSTVEQAHC